jgi:hypothetical protein
MKMEIIYEVSLTGSGQNFYTLYRHAHSPKTPYISTFIKNLSVDFEEACVKAREISGPDEDTETYKKILILDGDEANAILRGDDVVRFGKYQGWKVSEIYAEDKKYVSWLAGGAMVKSKQNQTWNSLIEGTNREPLMHHAIGLLIAGGEWIERNGKMMPVERAARLDYIESLTPNPKLKDKDRVKSILVKVLGKVWFNDNMYGGSFSWKMIDENNHVYNMTATNLPHLYNKNGYTVSLKDIEEDAWVEIAFSVTIHDNKVYAKRIKLLNVPELIN